MAVKYIHMGPVFLTVGYAFTKADYLREMRKHGVSDPPEFVAAGCSATVHHFDNTTTGESIALLCIPIVKSLSIPQVAALIAHEAVHVMQAACSAMDEKRAGSEFEAYTVQYVTQQVLGAYLERRKHG